MKQILTERGLMISSESLYSTMQDIMDYNFTAYLKAIILKPGLRISKGDEFSVSITDTKLIVKIGSVVFNDYSVFVPDENITTTELDISTLSQGTSETTGFNVWIVPEFEDSHYVNKARSKNLTATVRRRTMRVVVTSEGTTPGLNSYLIAMGGFNVDGTVDIIQNALNNILKLIPVYRSESWNLSSGVFPVVTGIKSKYGIVNHEKALSFREKPINKESTPNNTRSYCYVDLSWPSPKVAELDAIGGLAYYAVKVTPIVSGVEIDSKSIVKHLIFSRNDAINSLSIWTGLRVGLDWGVSYNARIYRVTNHLDLTVSLPSDPVLINEEDATVIPGSIDISYAYSSSDMLLLSHKVEYTNTRYQKVYVCEFSSSSPGNIKKNRYLFYTGPIQDVIYMISNKNRAYVKVDIVVFNEEHRVIGLGSSTQEIKKIAAKWEDLIVIPMPESNTGWPRPTGESFGAVFSASSSGIPGDLALVIVDLDNGIRDECVALMSPGIGVTISGTSVSELDGDRILREVDEDGTLYDASNQDASLNVDYEGTISVSGYVSFPDKQVIYSFSKATPFIISRVFMRGNLSSIVAPGSELLVTISGITYSYSIVVDENGQGELGIKDKTKVFEASEVVDVFLSLNGGTAAYNASGLTLLVYTKEVR